MHYTAAERLYLSQYAIDDRDNWIEDSENDSHALSPREYLKVQSTDYLRYLAAGLGIIGARTLSREELIKSIDNEQGEF